MPLPDADAPIDDPSSTSASSPAAIEPVLAPSSSEPERVDLFPSSVGAVSTALPEHPRSSAPNSNAPSSLCP
jgi:hypothetical protein